MYLTDSGLLHALLDIGTAECPGGRGAGGIERANKRGEEAGDKADQCGKSRERYEKYSTSQRLYEMLPDGSRRYLSDAEIEAARASAKASMDVMCK